MATTIPLNGRWKTIVRVKGADTETKTHDTKREGEKWGMELEEKIRGRLKLSSGFTLGQIISAFLVTKGEGYYHQQYCLTRFATDFNEVEIKEMTAEWWEGVISSWECKPVSRLNYLMRLRGVMKWAKNGKDKIKFDWAALQEAQDCLIEQKILSFNYRARKRRVTDADILKVRNCGYQSDYPYADMFEFSVHTCMRMGEVLDIRWSDLNGTDKEPMIWIRDRKDPQNKEANDGNIPLFARAYAIIKRQPRIVGEDRIFPFNARTFSRTFAKIVRRAGLKGMCFHDARHEGITRLFAQGFAIEEVSQISGHKNWKTLKAYMISEPQNLHRGPVANLLAAQARRLRAA